MMQGENNDENQNIATVTGEGSALKEETHDSIRSSNTHVVPPRPLLVMTTSTSSNSGGSMMKSMMSGMLNRTPKANIPTPTSSDQLMLPSDTELIVQLQRLCQRQHFRVDERVFARDVEKIVIPFKQSTLVTETNILMEVPAVEGDAPNVHIRNHQHISAEDVTDGIIANLSILLDAMQELFTHRHEEIQLLAFDVVNLMLTQYGLQFTHSMRRTVFQHIEHHHADWDMRQQTLRLLTQDGRVVEPFQVEMGWLLLQWLEESNAQSDLLHLMGLIFRRNPRALDFETVIAISSIICGRCDLAWSRGDIDTCKRFLSFFHILATHNLEHALSTSVCLRTLCCMVNADGHATWSVMKHLLNGSAGFHVVRGLVTLLENASQYNQWVLRGAVFFVGMSCWGSQRVAKLEQVKWAPILLALESCLHCNNGVVVFEIILALQRLIKKYGDASSRSPTNKNTKTTSKRIGVEWDIILRMFRALRPWLSMNEVSDNLASDNLVRDRLSAEVAPMAMAVRVRDSSSTLPTDHVAVPIHQTRIPRELMDTLLFVHDLVKDNKFAGEVDELYNIMEEYLPFLPEQSTLLLLRYRAAASHPAYHVDWLQTLEQTMQVFFTNEQMPTSVRLEALELLQVNLWSSRNVCEDRVLEEVLIPTLLEVYDDPRPEVRRRGLDLITEVARQLESIRFDSLLDILENAVVVSAYEDSQQFAITGIVSLFSSYFNHLPQSRALRMYELITSVVESHRQFEVRRCALECLLRVCEATSDYRLQWKDTIVRTSRFLYCSRASVRNHQASACIPVYHGLRALLTLISTESHALLFRMAVDGLRTMLTNRVILEDVDISDIALKIMSCVDYRAFGRVAIPDEMNRVMKDMGLNATSAMRNMRIEGNHRRRRATETDIARVVALSNNTNSDTHTSSVRSVTNGTMDTNAKIGEVVSSLCKTRFITMGLELLQLFIGFMGKLNDEAKHQLMMCFVGAINTQPTESAHESTLNSRSSDIGVSTNLPPTSRTRERCTSSGPDAIFASLRIQTAHHERSPSTQLPSSHSKEDVQAKPVSPDFTSRMLSRLQSGSQTPGIFGSSFTTRPSPSLTSNAENMREEYIQLTKCRSLLYDAEFNQLHVSSNSISLLALVIPQVITSRLDLLLSGARTCFQTKGGELCTDRFATVLEMFANVINVGIAMDLSQKKRVIDLALVAFQFSMPKATCYVAYRVLSQLVLVSGLSDRFSLADGALPVLRECTRIPHVAQIADTAIDFLMCFALSRTMAPIPALRSFVDGGPSAPSEEKLQSRTWVYESAIVTIETRKNCQADVFVRRASGMSRWSMAFHDRLCSQNSHSDRLEHKGNLSQTIACSGDTMPVTSMQDDDNKQSTPRYQLGTGMSRSFSRFNKQAITPERYLWKSKAAAVNKRHVEVAMYGIHEHSPVPPLPAYDGVGGSPSYFCGVIPPDPCTNELGHTDISLTEGTVSTENAILDEELPMEEKKNSFFAQENDHDSSTSFISTTHNDNPNSSILSREPIDSVSPHQTPPCEHGAVWNESTIDIDPLYLMMQFFDLSADRRPSLLAESAALSLGLSVLDRTPEYETHKIGVLYVRNTKQKTEIDILRNTGGTLRYLRFLRGLGTITKLHNFTGYTGGMDTANDSDGKYSLLYKNECLQMVFHVATMMTSMDESREMLESASMPTTNKKKRHIGNDFVHIIFKECDEEYDVHTFSGQFNDVHIIVQPLDDNEYRTQVHCKPGIAPFGPLYGTQVIPFSILAESVRLTALNANLACQAFHQDLIGFTMNCEARLKLIKQLGVRHATTENWTFETPRSDTMRSTPI